MVESSLYQLVKLIHCFSPGIENLEYFYAYFVNLEINIFLITTDILN